MKKIREVKKFFAFSSGICMATSEGFSGNEKPERRETRPQKAK